MATLKPDVVIPVRRDARDKREFMAYNWKS